MDNVFTEKHARVFLKKLLELAVEEEYGIKIECKFVDREEEENETKTN